MINNGSTKLIMVLLLLSFNTVLFSQNLKIFHIDVEQGDATLLISPSGKTLLIDSGKNGHGSRIKQILDQEGISNLDYFVCTHYHEDHYGGIDELIKQQSISVGTAYDRGDKESLPQDKLTGDTYSDYQDAIGKNARHLTRGETIPFDSEVSVTCISSGGVVLAEDEPVPGIHENDLSISLLVQYGSFRYFNGGDIELTTEGKIASRDMVMDVDVYKANHHASHTSSSRDFMDDLTPSVIIISNGNHGGFKHPRQHTLDLFSRLKPKTKVFQTNKYLKGSVGGNVPDSHIADLVPDGPEGTILIEVEKDLGNYIVSFRDTTCTFQNKDRGTNNFSLVIESVLPNPIGSDIELEEVTIKNTGNTAISLIGFILKDESGRIWPLGHIGEIDSGASATILRNRMPMSLNNDGDKISLFGPDVQLLDEFSYDNSQEGIVINTNNE